MFHISRHFQELNDNIQSYIASTVEYYRLVAFKISAKGISKLIQAVIVLSMFMFFLSFVSIGASLLIGNALGALYIGFFIVGGFYFLVFIIFFIFRKSLIDSYVLNKASTMVMNEGKMESVVDDVVNESYQNANSEEDEKV